MATTGAGPAGGSGGTGGEWHVDQRWYTGFRWTLGTILRTYFRLRESGLANVPRTGATVLIANHSSWLDPWLIARPLPRTIAWMTKVEWFSNPLLAHVLREIGCFPVDRDARDPRAIKTALQVLRQGELLGIFPEGTRSRTNTMGEFHPGAVRLAEKADAPIVPAAVVGSRRLMPSGSILPRPGVIHIRYGPPFRLADLYGARLTEAARDDALAECRRRIEALM